MLYLDVEGRLARGEISSQPRSLRSWVERKLMTLGSETSEGGDRLQAFGRILNHGSDPRRVVRRIAREEHSVAGSVEYRIVSRQVPDRDGSRRGASKTVEYAEVSIDLVAQAETYWSGSMRWFDAPLWRLISPPLMALEEIRATASVLLDQLGLFRSSRHQRDLFDLHAPATAVEQERDVTSRYKASLLPLAMNPTATSF